jgi:hypothetical protein
MIGGELGNSSASDLAYMKPVWPKLVQMHLNAVLAPDIYFRSFTEWCDKYDQTDNPLFIPEVANTQSVANAYYAIAKHDAMGYSPFSIESMENPDAGRTKPPIP